MKCLLDILNILHFVMFPVRTLHSLLLISVGVFKDVTPEGNVFLSMKVVYVHVGLEAGMSRTQIYLSVVPQLQAGMKHY